MSEKKIMDIISDRFNEMPMLKLIFSNFIYESQISLSKHIDDHVEVKAEAIIPINALEYTGNIQNATDCIVVEYKFSDWNTQNFFLFINKNIVYKMIEIILGGKKLEHSLDVQDRTFSEIEKKIIEGIVDVLTSNLQNVFLLADSAIRVIKKAIYYSKYDAPELQDNVSFLGRSEIKIKDILGKIDVIVPYETLLPIKSSLIKTFSNKKLIQQDSWKNHMKHSLSVVSLDVTVEVEATQTISEIEKMKVGDTIITNKAAAETFDVKVNGLKVGECKIGKVSEKLAVELVNTITL